MIVISGARAHWLMRSGALMCRAPEPPGDFTLAQGSVDVPACAACALVLLQLDLPRMDAPMPAERPSVGLAALQSTSWPRVIRLEKIDGPDRWGSTEPEPDPPAAAAIG